MKSMPSTARGRRSRAAILDAAAELMHARGIAGPSIDDLLAASGTGKSQLYHYFGGRRELVEAMLRYQFDRVVAAQPALTDLACDDLDRWRDQVLEAQRAHGLGTCPLGVFVGQVEDDPVLRATLTDLFARWQDAIAGLVVRARQVGRVRPDVDANAAALSLLTAHQGGTVLSHLRRDLTPLADALDSALAPLRP